MATLGIAESDEDILRCFPVIQQLRPDLVENDFLPRVRAQQGGGFQLAFLEADGSVRAVAGYRFIDNLVSGRVLYIDDLVTDSTARSKGYGSELFAWLVDVARDANCQTVELDSGVQRFDAHRFYLVNRMVISSHHFLLVLQRQ